MIDWTKVTELVADVGRDGYEEVVELFLQEVDTALQTIALSDDLEASLHFVKGCAMNLGFSEVARLFTEGEALAAKGRPDEVDLIALHKIYHDSRELFLTEVQHRIAA